jgi:hypothetical protein
MVQLDALRMRHGQPCAELRMTLHRTLDSDAKALEGLSKEGREVLGMGLLKWLAWAVVGGFALGVVTTLLAVAVTWAVVT